MSDIQTQNLYKAGLRSIDHPKLPSFVYAWAIDEGLLASAFVTDHRLHTTLLRL